MAVIEDYTRFRGEVNTLPTRYTLACPTKPESFSGPGMLSRGRRPVSNLKFNIKDDLEITKANMQLSDVDIKMAFPVWIRGEIDCHTVDKKICPQDVVRVCCDRAIKRLIATSEYNLWDKLKSILQKHKWPANSDDFTDFNRLTKEFSIHIFSPTNGERTKRRSYRFPYDQAELMGAVSNSLGSNLQELVTGLTLDGLRGQKEAVHVDKMDETISELYYCIGRRTRFLYACVKSVWEIEPSTELQEIMDEIESEMGL